jgi:hypothetical protein
VIDLKAGSAQSLLVFETGPNGGLQGKLVTDELTAPAAGSGRLRLVQGAEGAGLTVTASGGTELARDVAYGTTTPYSEVPSGHWDLQLKAGNSQANASVDIAPASITTVLVIMKDGTLSITSIADSTGSATTPVGGVQTGAGGTEPASYAWLLAAFLAAVALAGAVASRRVRAR